MIKAELNSKGHEPYKTEKIQATSIKIQHKHGETTVAAVYCPPRHSITAEEFEQFFKQLGPVFIYGDDWNAKHNYWGSRLINPRGRQLYKANKNLNLESISHGEPTYWPTDLNKIPDLLDFYITKNVGQHYLKIEKCEDLSSDHTPVILNLFKHVVPIESPDYTYNKNTNWNLFREIISGKVDLNIRLKTNDDIETSIEKFNSIIHTAAFTSTPKPKKRIVKVKQKDYPRSIVEKVRERRKLRSEWHRTRYPIDKTRLNKATKQLKDMIKEHENSCLQSHLSHLTADKDTNYSLWRATKTSNDLKSCSTFEETRGSLG
ncbi:RNA-directed DNA polymerase from mobile element jockey [Eumeta japonica]|uniref:RNA-directed DNA polymerase from mobile element jockey n=1 Tax=Eumeta variegata TaxID=151549 RepID=A0A4C1ULT8_EUMVA|nr:RNA-directed DNA polymerase from mobile element jockey [Eumeta japonica]